MNATMKIFNRGLNLPCEIEDSINAEINFRLLFYNLEGESPLNKPLLQRIAHMLIVAFEGIKKIFQCTQSGTQFNGCPPLQVSVFGYNFQFATKKINKCFLTADNVDSRLNLPKSKLLVFHNLSPPCLFV